MHRSRTKVVVGLIALVVVVVAAAGGRHLLSGGGGGAEGASNADGASSVRDDALAPTPSTPAASAHRSTAAAGSIRPAGLPTVSSGSTGPVGGATLPAVPTAAVTPQVVHTATIDLRVGKGKLESVVHALTSVAAAEGGFVESSALSGGSARRAPDAGTLEMRVLDSEFADTVTAVGDLGTVEDQHLNGKDVTVQETRNSASIFVLQSEVNLLEAKLSQATDITTFLQVENQLIPVENQLQQLQSSQAVLENQAALATVTVDLSAPGTPLTAPTPPRHTADAATTAWNYLRHNTLAVLDGLAVAGGWALPVLVLLGLLGAAALRVFRRRRAISAA